MTPPTKAKTIRVSAAELAVVEQLLHHFPRLATEASLLTEACRIGLLVLAADATRPGGTPLGGYLPADLAQQLNQQMRGVFEFLAQHQALPLWLTTAPQDAGVSHAAAPVLTEATIDPAAAQAVADMGSDLL